MMLYKSIKDREMKNELIAMLTSPVISYRCLSTVALLQLGKIDRVKAELKSAPDSVKHIFASAVWFAGKNAVATLEELAKSKIADIRLRVAQSCGFMKNAELKSVLLKLSKDKDSNVIGCAENALEAIGV